MSRILLVMLILGFLGLGCDQGNNTDNPEGYVPNQPPGITSAPVVTATSFNPYTYQVTAIDSEGDPISYSLEIFPEGMTIDTASGLIQWTPAFEQIGQNFVKILATDGQHDPTIQSFFINVLEGTPLLTFNIAVDPAVYIIGDPTLSITATGVPDGGTLTFDVANAGGTGGLFTFPTALGTAGPSPATFSFGGAIEGGVASVNITFTPPNQDPITETVLILVRFSDGTFTYRSNPRIEIPESGGGPIDDTIPVVGFTGTITSVFLMLNIPNTYAGDLQIFLTHEPTNTQVELTTGNGGGGFNFFAPVIFDDNGVDGPVTAISTSGGRYVPEGLLSTFNGLNANGDWTIQIEDVLGIDVGILLTWILIFEGTSTPPLKTFGTSWDLENSINGTSDSLVPNGGTLNSTIPISFAPNVITDVRVELEIETPLSGDLTVRLRSPSGSTVTLSANNGTGADMAIIFDDSVTTPISTFTGTPGNPEPFPFFIPENSIAPLLSGNPNGDWTLIITDAGGDTADSLLRSWYISFNGDTTIF